MRGWLKGGQPACFPLPVFFFPQGFMTGTLQTFARKYQVTCCFYQSNHGKHGRRMYTRRALCLRFMCVRSHNLNDFTMAVATLPCSCIQDGKQHACLCLALGEAVEAHALLPFVLVPKLRSFCDFGPMNATQYSGVISRTTAVSRSFAHKKTGHVYGTVQPTKPMLATLFHYSCTIKGGDRYAHLQVQCDARRPC